MEQDYVDLCVWLNSLKVEPGWEWHSDMAHTKLRQLLLDMLDKGPEHLIGVWRMYINTRHDDKEIGAYEK